MALAFIVAGIFLMMHSGADSDTALSGGSSMPGKRIENEQDLLQWASETTNGRLLIWANWCGACRNFKPTWEKLVGGHQKEIDFAHLEASTDKNLLQRLGVKAFPTILVMSNGTIEHQTSQDPNAIVAGREMMKA